MDKTEVLVIGAGPGGYTAAFTAADLGLNVTLVDPAENPGGVCLYKGCIPSKALLHVAKNIREAEGSEALGVSFGSPEIDLEKVKTWKDGVVSKLTGGLGQLCKLRKINYMRGTAGFLDNTSVKVDMVDGGSRNISFDNAILATGSEPYSLPFADFSERVMDSSSALNIKDIPEKMLIVGAGYIGLEMATIYSALGSGVTMVEMTDSMLPGTDKDLVLQLKKRINEAIDSMKFSTKVVGIKEEQGQVTVTTEDAQGNSSSDIYDRVLISAGRKAVLDGVGLENTDIQYDSFIKVDNFRRTKAGNIYAIGDITGQPMLAHKAAYEGKVAAHSIAGKHAEYKDNAIPSVVFTDPEIAVCGITEMQAREKGIGVKVLKFPWAASGRAATLGRSEGVTKIIADSKTEKVLGVGIAGTGAGELIAEGAIAVSAGLKVSDISSCVHPHPTLSETVMESAELLFGASTHFYRPPRG